MNFDEWWNEDYDDSENPFEKDLCLGIKRQK
jgi:hypothetical protein